MNFTKISTYFSTPKILGFNGDTTSFAWYIYSCLKAPLLIVCPSQKMVESLSVDLNFFDLGHVCLPPFDVRPYRGLSPNPTPLKMKALYESKSKKIFLCSIEALIQKTIPKNVFFKNTIFISNKTKIDQDLNLTLQNMGYYQQARVSSFGQFAVRGCVLDVYSPNYQQPVRLEFFDEEISSIRFFDPRTGKSTLKIDKAYIIPFKEVIINEETRSRAFFEFQKDLSLRTIPKNKAANVLSSINSGLYFAGIEYLIDYYYSKTNNLLEYFDFHSLVLLDYEKIKATQNKLLEDLEDQRIRARQNLILPAIDRLYEPVEFDINFKTHKINSFNFELTQNLEKNLKLIQTKVYKYKIAIAANTEQASKRANVVLKSFNPQTTTKFLFNKSFQILSKSINNNVELTNEKLLLVNFSSILNKKSIDHKTTDATDEFFDSSRNWLLDISFESKILHKDHGIGNYRGLKTMNIQGKDNEFLEIAYKNNDKLYLPVFKLSQVQRYTGQGEVNKLGGDKWQNQKLKVKKRTKDITLHLISLYAKRKKSIRPPFLKPTEEYKKFEESFEYEETLDQTKAIRDIEDDLQREIPMDRLIAGDVGFGKTEVAMRAIYYTIENGGQVLFLVPTTILCLQHYNTLLKRFDLFPVNIRSLSRFSKKNEIQEIEKNVKTGLIDVVIGTHKLLNKDLKMKNLSLVIIDEEQKFGVLQKEKIKKLKNNLNFLSISATPIPRTLNMSLMGLRDLSLIKTPPKNRIPIRTFLIDKDKQVIRDAILSETKRGGQVLYVYNRVAHIYKIEEELKNLVPEVKIKVAHGQMNESELEKVAIDFYNSKFELLLCTTIIESGLDIPQVNTMFIERADYLGLSQLYQLRGRIGRSSVSSFCYLLTSKTQPISESSKNRLDLLREFSKLGDGFQIARQDMENRGSGNILGDEQAGHIDEVGFELYMELLEESINEAKNITQKKNIDPDVDIPVSALIPNKYMPDVRTRIYFYRQLSKAKSTTEIDEIEEKIRDQFGPLPKETNNLLGVMTIRVFCKMLDIYNLKCNSKFLILSFTNEPSINTSLLISLTKGRDKYVLKPNNQLKIKIKSESLNEIYTELLSLESKVKI